MKSRNLSGGISQSIFWFVLLAICGTAPAGAAPDAKKAVFCITGMYAERRDPKTDYFFVWEPGTELLSLYRPSGTLPLDPWQPSEEQTIDLRWGELYAPAVKTPLPLGKFVDVQVQPRGSKDPTSLKIWIDPKNLSGSIGITSGPDTSHHAMHCAHVVL